MKTEPDRIRIKDIAKMAGVSVGTVDRVLHGRTGVAESSKKKVEEILKQLNYQPNMYASALASNKKYHFVCLLPQHSTNDYWTDVIKGLENAVKKALMNSGKFIPWQIVTISTDGRILD